MKRILVRSLLIVAVLATALSTTAPLASPSAAQNNSLEDFLNGAVAPWFGPTQNERVIVMLTPGSPLDRIVNTLNSRGGFVSQTYDRAINGFAATLPGWLVDILEGYPEVISVEPDLQVTVADTPTGVERIFADDNAAIDIDEVDDLRVDADIAIIDTGIAPHPDLNIASTISCASFSGCSGSSVDQNGHGTHVAGTAAALDNGIGVVGVAPGARLHGIQVLDSSGRGYISWVVAGIERAIDLGNVDVANLSLSCACSSSSLNTAVNNAVNSGIVVVAAAGNSATNASGTNPGAHPAAIGVSALADSDGEPGGTGGSPWCRSDGDDTFANFSNYGSTVDIIAPGVCIESTHLNGGYATYSGTSMAAPHVAGAAALLASNNHPSNASGVQAIANTLYANGNFNWNNSDDGDNTKEPLLDVSAGVFAPTMVVGPETPPGPSASFSYDCTYLSCSFTDTSTPGSAAITGWSWDFADVTLASVSSEQDPTHEFPGPGTYAVELTVTDSNNDTDSTTSNVSVGDNPAPTAAFTMTCTYLQCSFTDTSSDDTPLGGITKWEWDFDNNGSVDQTLTGSSGNTSHTYASGGAKTAKLTVTDNAATPKQNSTTRNRTLTANTAPTASFNVSCTYLQCSFTDTSTDDPSGSVASWSWNFGDGQTSTQQNPTHTYSSSGNRTVTLTVTDDRGLVSAQASKTADPTDPPPNPAPDADFTASCNHLQCSFTDTSTDDGTITAWAWDFDDSDGVGSGATSSAQNPSFTFPSTGNYQVTLSVTDNGGPGGAQNDTVTKQVSVTANAAPTASFTHNCVNLTCTFTDTSTDDDGTVQTWLWNFGDGSVSTQRNPTHTYSSGGTRTVTFAVTDDDGASDGTSASVTATPPPLPAINLTSSRSGFWVPTVTLNWTGVIPGSVDVYRNNSLYSTTNNDGSQAFSLGFFNFTVYSWRVCHAGTNVCSQTVQG